MKKNITIGEKYEPAMKVQTKEEAAAYFDECVRHTMSFGVSEEEAIRIERVNIGYFAGYYDYETRQRIEKLYDAPHPIFGSRQPTTDEALMAGVRLAKGITKFESPKSSGSPSATPLGRKNLKTKTSD